MRAEAAACAEDVKTDEGDTLARISGAKLLAKPSDIQGAGPRAPAEAASESSEDSSCSSGSEEDIPTKEALSFADQVSALSAIWASYTHTQKRGPVHLTSSVTAAPTEDSDHKLSMLCGKRIFSKNAECDTVLNLRHSIGLRPWCDRCRAKADASVAKAVFE